ncbi:MAG: hypothetical protein HPY64_08160 [Anaerolineae bacterium]|nr:hypothetical protein [Anaerolineae bacterium]
MPDLFVATLGQRPEAITVALDLLKDRYHFARVVILHTEPHLSGIAEARERLAAVFTADYPALAVDWHEIHGADGGPLLDITSQDTANAYFQDVLITLRNYRAEGYTIHLLVAGGRKAMSVYATLAAALIFGPRDRVWTVLSPEEMLRSGGFHIPPGLRDQVTLVDLPVLPPRLNAAEIAVLDRPLELIARRRDPRQVLLSRLTPSERQLAELFELHPYASDGQLAQILGKDRRTVENQMRAIYQKMFDLCEEAETATRKRQVLLDILTGRV